MLFVKIAKKDGGLNESQKKAKSLFISAKGTRLKKAK